MSNDSVLPILLRLFKLEDASVIQVRGGGNSKVFRLKHKSHDLALKVYTGDQARNRRSLKHELEAFRILKDEKVIKIAHFVDSNEEIPSLLYEWIDGLQPENTKRSRKAILEGIKRLNKLGVDVKCELKAIDSIANSDDIINQIQQRHETFLGVVNLPQSFSSRIENTKMQVFHILKERMTFGFDTLSFSDYGVHNLLEDQNSNIYFIDFEFFGRDSSAKLFSDLVAHPKGIFSSREILKMLGEQQIDERFLTSGFLAAIALKWVYIILRRSIDLETGTFKGLNTEFEDPYQYLQYVEHLLGMHSKHQFCTFTEFKSMR